MLMLLFNGWFGIFFFEILKAVVYQMFPIFFIPNPTDQFGLFEVFYASFK